MIFDRSFGNFRKVMALEFILHIVLPIAMVIGFIAGFSHIGLLITYLESNSTQLILCLVWIN